MSNDKKCFFCGTECEKYTSFLSYPINRYSCSFCGDYSVVESSHFYGDINISDPSIKFKIACVLNQRRLRGLGGIALGNKTNVENEVHGHPQIAATELLAQFPRTASEVLNSILLNLSRLALRPFSEISLNFNTSCNMHFFTKDIGECFTILNELSEQGFIRKGNSTMEERETILTSRGWENIEKLQQTAIDSKRAFVAMWFDSSMSDFYDNGIKPAVIKADYDPIRIDTQEFNSKICDEIIAEIKRSKFMISDFTGQRGGVYFEAGYAMGQNKPVIFVVKEDDLKTVHFDTRQYNHIVYNSPEELRKKLYDRICATIV